MGPEGLEGLEGVEGLGGGGSGGMTQAALAREAARLAERRRLALAAELREQLLLHALGGGADGLEAAMRRAASVADEREEQMQRPAVGGARLGGVTMRALMGPLEGGGGLGLERAEHAEQLDLPDAMGREEPSGVVAELQHH
ncbi:MAG: hypothetical protein OEY14_17205 [Myxococcales bacterium]|nr:hypothetical protein [Myxococcales bacterium]